jgi:RHS repeat-associated protein
MADAYRYGFNGKEKEDGINIDNYDFSARIYDARVGRWLSVDPMAHKYPDLCPFVAFGDAPIIYTDPGGETLRIFYASTHIDYTPGMKVSGDDYLEKTVASIEALMKLDPFGIVNALVSTSSVISIRKSLGSDHFNQLDNSINYDPTIATQVVSYPLINGKESTILSQSFPVKNAYFLPVTTLYHEMIHAFLFNMYPEINEDLKSQQLPLFTNMLEKVIITNYETTLIQIMNNARDNDGKPYPKQTPRKNHSGEDFKVEGPFTFEKKDHDPLNDGPMKEEGYLDPPDYNEINNEDE